jgi:hypothetical protein
VNCCLPYINNLHAFLSSLFLSFLVHLAQQIMVAAAATAATTAATTFSAVLAVCVADEQLADKAFSSCSGKAARSTAG